MEVYHKIWLDGHPDRSEAWLEDRLKDGFDIHHVNGDHYGNDPTNLVLIESRDHMMIHNGSLNMVRPLRAGTGRPRGNKLTSPAHCMKVYALKMEGYTWSDIASACGVTIGKAKQMAERHEAHLHLRPYVKPVIGKKILQSL